MKGFLLVFLFFVSLDGPGDIAKMNELKKKAKESYLKKDYQTAITNYKKLVEDYKVNDGRVLLNLGNAYYELKDTANASTYYQQVATMPDRDSKSLALSQLGVISYNKQNLKEALAFFKESLKTNPENENARYNYELVKKKLLADKDNNKDGDDQKQKDENKEEPSDFAKKLKEQAELLVMQRKYKEALNLMNNGLSKDPTVAHYKDFITRINDVVEIDE